MSELTKDEINQRIHLRLGWTPTPNGAWTKDPAGLAGPYSYGEPDYYGSLDAIATAVDTLTNGQQSRYLIALAKSMGARKPWELFYPESWQFFTATAHQRALAFLEVVG